MSNSAPEFDPNALARAFQTWGDKMKAAFGPMAALSALIKDDPDHAQHLLTTFPDDLLSTVERAATQLSYRAADIRAERARNKTEETS